MNENKIIQFWQSINNFKTFGEGKASQTTIFIKLPQHVHCRWQSTTVSYHQEDHCTPPVE